VHYKLPGVVIALIHDIAVTPDYYVVAVGPIDFSLSKFMTQYLTSRCSIAECMEYKEKERPTTVHLVPRPGGRAGACMCRDTG
jgi:all-trans-8'-apo-beta-carotenal 15,15'-oxygenase